MERKLLNLGCGNRFHPSWTNVDMFSRNPQVIAYDLRTGVPFGSESFDMIYHSHVLEHFTREDGKRFIVECFRVLKPGGILRVCVPNLEDTARNYVAELDKVIAGDVGALPNHEWMTIELIDQMVRNRTGGEMGAYLVKKDLLNEDFVYKRIGEEGRHFREVHSEKEDRGESARRTWLLWLRHSVRTLIKNVFPEKLRRVIQVGRFRNRGEVHQWMYDRVSLAILLKESGFKEVNVMTAMTSHLPNWTEYELDAMKSGLVIKPDSLFVEARK